MILIFGFVILMLELTIFRGLMARFQPLPVILAAVGTSVIGYLVLRFQGRMAQARVQAMMQEGADPALVMEGILARSIGAILLLVPGFLSDFLGLTLLLPLTRPIWRLLLRKRFGQGGMGGMGGASPFGFPMPTDRGPAQQDPKDERVVDADFEVID